MIDIVNNLSDILNRSSTDDLDDSLPLLRQWNELVEYEIQHPPTCDAIALLQDNGVDDVVDRVSHQLLFALLSGLSRDDAVPHDQSNECFNILPEISQDFLQKLRNGSCAVDRFDDNTEAFQILRGAQNWLRWCLQIHEPILVTQKKKMQLLGLNKLWRTRDMLEIYLRLIIHFAPMSADMARFSSQLLFYASYNNATWCGDEMKESYVYLTQTCNLFSEVLRVLLQTDQIRLQLSLMKVIHNSYVCFPNLKANIVEASADVESIQNPAKWISSASPFTIKTACWDIMRNQLSERCEHEFPGSKGNRRSELVVEILRVFYALKVGAELASDPNNDPVIIDILSLDPTDEQCYECQQGVISLLMDAHPTFSDAIVASAKATNVLSYTLEHQINVVLDTKLMDDRAVPSVIPILVILNKFSKGNLLMRKSFFEHVFPLSDEDRYEKLVIAELAKSNGKAKNMSPLDAPKDSLRWKMIQLMTRPHSFVKRTTGELLWTLCDEDPQQLVLRIGMGNALPFLGMKGVVPMPMSTLVT